MKKVFKYIGITLMSLVAIGAILFFIYLKPFMDKMKVTETIQLDPSITLVTGGGGNSGIIVGDSLVVVIDTKMDDAATEFHKQVMNLAGSKPILVINTHWHPDHVGGNKLFANQQILAGGSYDQDEWIKEAGKESLPTQWLLSQQIIPLGNDTLIVFNLAKDVHTPSDVMVYLPGHKLLFGGDVILNKQAPVLMGKASAAAYEEVLASLPSKMDIKTVVPGHGKIGGPEIITDFAAYFTDMREAASNSNKEEELVAKYKEWNQIPFFMSPKATIDHYKK
ncbi:MAG: hypothetical protein CFE21_15625 [Bacteroidetes bacterium B1(2017)]|nr:MAG: hypothetical protein CFE21_15625 [Bacteroidetes bacterium B1(2017)]